MALVLADTSLELKLVAYRWLQFLYVRGSTSGLLGAGRLLLLYDARNSFVGAI